MFVRKDDTNRSLWLDHPKKATISHHQPEVKCFDELRRHYPTDYTNLVSKKRQANGVGLLVISDQPDFLKNRSGDVVMLNALLWCSVSRTIPITQN